MIAVKPHRLPRRAADLNDNKDSMSYEIPPSGDAGTTGWWARLFKCRAD
jgi:hypothetical protein